MALAAESPSNTLPHLASPFLLGPTGAFEVFQQDTEEEVAQSVAVLLNTRPGERIVTPDYGFEEPAFRHVTAAEIEAVVAQWEPRASVAASVQPQSDGSSRITVRVGLSGNAAAT